MWRPTPALAATVTIAAALSAAIPARSDPVFPVPSVGRLRWGDSPEDPLLVGAILEARLLGIPASSRLAAWPDRRLGLDPGAAAIDTIRVGAVANLRRAPFSFALAIDAAEPARPRLGGDELFDEDPGVAVNRLVQDAYAVWRPVRSAHFILGRARVPWSKIRQFDEVDLPLGASPFVIDRLAPDRRWGLALVGDLGSIAYAAGAWEDLDALEPRVRAPVVGGPPADPSSGGAAALAVHLEWTPRAPMMGSNPPGRVPGASGPMPTPRADPWFSTPRTSIGIGALWRIREDRSSQLDASLSAELKWRWLGVLTEGIVSSDGRSGGRGLTAGAHGTVMVAPIDAVGLLGRAEWDGGAGTEGEWTLGAGAVFYPTRSRRDQVGFLGVLRRDVARGTRADAAVVVLQSRL